MARQTSTGLTSTRDEGSGEVEAIEVHDLVPRGNEVVHELVLRVVTCVDLGDGSELRVRTEDEVDCCGGPVELSRHAIADRKSTRLNSSHMSISYAVFCLKKKRK